MITTILAIAAYTAALTTAYLFIGWLDRVRRGLKIRKGCRGCYLLGQIPFGPPYWLLRWHLRHACRAMDREEELL